MSDYVYSASLNMICAAALKNDYQLAGTWPTDAESLDEAAALEFMNDAPEGKIMVAGAGGLPAWADIPPLTAEQLQQAAENKKSRLLSDVSMFTQQWQTQLLLGIITEQDKALLTEWMRYVQQLQAVNTSDPVWPTPPDIPAR